MVKRVLWMVLAALALYQAYYPHFEVSLPVTHAAGEKQMLMAPVVEGVSTAAPSALNDAVSGNSDSPLSCSRDGRYVVFVSPGKNLVSGQINFTSSYNNVFLYDRVTRKQTLVSHRAGAPTTCGNKTSYDPSISGDGNYVVFYSDASDLVANSNNPNNLSGIYLFERGTGNITLVSHKFGLLSTPSEGTSLKPLINRDGKFVVYLSNANDLLPAPVGAPFSFNQVYLFDRTTSQTTLVSHMAANSQLAGDSHCHSAQLSSDGESVSFVSFATNLAAGQVNLTGTNLFIFNRSTGNIRLVSHDNQSLNTSGNGASEPARFSPDGRYLVFSSAATNLVAGGIDNNQTYDVFLYDQVTGVNRLVSHAANSTVTSGNLGSSAGACSTDGRFVVFNSSANNLIGMPNGGIDPQIYLFDSASGGITLVSHAAGSPTTLGNGPCGFYPVIGEDGIWLAFDSRASNLIPGQTGGEAVNVKDIFVYNRLTGGLSLASHHKDSSTVSSNSYCGEPVISAQGNIILYASGAGNLVEGVTDANQSTDLFAYRVADGKNDLVTVRDVNSPSVMGGVLPTVPTHTSVSQDGRFVVINSGSVNLVDGQIDTPGSEDVFLKDRQTGITTLVSHRAGSLATAGNSRSWFGSVSGDGRFVVFGSDASDLVAGITTSTGFVGNLYLYDRLDGAIRLVSHAAQSVLQIANGSSSGGTISEDGSIITFTSSGSNYIPGQIPSQISNVYAYEVATGAVTLISQSAANPLMGGNGPSGNSYSSSLSRDGKMMVFTSFATNLVQGVTDTNEAADVFLANRTTGSLTLVSHAFNSLQIPVGGGTPIMSGDGTSIVYTSRAQNVVAGQIANSFADVFHYSVQTGQNTLVSRANGTTATEGNQESTSGCLSDNGDWIAFASYATNLVPEQPALTTSKIFLFHRPTATMRLVTHQPGQSLVPTSGGTPLSISGDGGTVCFISYSPNLIDGFVSAGNFSSAYVYYRDTDTNVLVSHQRLLPTYTATGLTNDPIISKDGSTVIFGQQSDELVLYDNNSQTDVFAARLRPVSTPSVSQFFPVASTSGKTITVTGSNFIPGNTEVFFGGPRRIPGGVATINSTTALVIVPPSQTGNGNINGYLTIVVNGVEVTTQGILAAAPDPSQGTATFPEFVLWGDLTGDGQMATNDVSLMRGFLAAQAIPTVRQVLAANVTPLNANGSRGDGNPLSSADFAFLRAVSLGQTQF